MSTTTISEISSLLNALEQSAQITDEQWTRSLTSRKIAELEFHDQWRGGHAKDEVETAARQSNKKYYATVGLSQAFMGSWIEENVKGKIVLDYACGDGATTIRAAKAGAALAIGLDISRVSIENARREAQRSGVADNTYFLQGDCENTGLPPESVDIVICCGMLHHLDLSFAFPELRRVMKPGGKCLAIEALNYNPAIKLYRMLTPAKRTDWEKRHILSLKDVQFAKRFFEVRNVRYWHLMSILTTPLRNTSLFAASLKLANKLDAVLLKMFPLSLLAWVFTFELCKRTEN
jgi:ubiquinone/menaquinone biosynthesis C-methylase UbiE